MNFRFVKVAQKWVKWENGINNNLSDKADNWQFIKEYAKNETMDISPYKEVQIVLVSDWGCFNPMSFNVDLCNRISSPVNLNVGFPNSTGNCNGGVLLSSDKTAKFTTFNWTGGTPTGIKAILYAR